MRRSRGPGGRAERGHVAGACAPGLGPGSCSQTLLRSAGLRWPAARCCGVRAAWHQPHTRPHTPRLTRPVGPWAPSTMCPRQGRSVYSGLWAAAGRAAWAWASLGSPKCSGHHPDHAGPDEGRLRPGRGHEDPFAHALCRGLQADPSVQAGQRCRSCHHLLELLDSGGH